MGRGDVRFRFFIKILHQEIPDHLSSSHRMSTDRWKTKSPTPSCTPLSQKTWDRENIILFLVEFSYHYCLRTIHLSRHGYMSNLLIPNIKLRESAPCNLNSSNKQYHNISMRYDLHHGNNCCLKLTCSTSSITGLTHRVTSMSIVTLP